jgi:hypothetical protein
MTKRDDAAEWAQRQKADAAERLAAIDRKKAAETEAATAQVQAFAAAARKQGLPTTRLRARSYNGRATYRTPLEGWYLKRNRTIAVATDGRYYVLSAPAGLAARCTGVEVAPSSPPLVVGAGGRDGESIPLSELLAQRLAAGADFPT